MNIMGILTFISSFDLQKYRCNAEPAANHEDLNNETSESVFDKLLEGESNHEENSRVDPVAAAVAAAVAQTTSKPKKKVVRSQFKDNIQGKTI